MLVVAISSFEYCLSPHLEEYFKILLFRTFWSAPSGEHSVMLALKHNTTWLIRRIRKSIASWPFVVFAEKIDREKKYVSQVDRQISEQGRDERARQRLCHICADQPPSFGIIPGAPSVISNPFWFADCPLMSTNPILIYNFLKLLII